MTGLKNLLLKRLEEALIRRNVRTMKRIFAGLVLLGCLAGCGSLNTGTESQAPSPTLRELAIVPNFASNTLSVKELDVYTGSVQAVGDPVPSAGTHPVAVRSHPNLKVFYVVNRDSQVITVFSLDVSGAASLISSVACPAQTQLFAVHPSGGWAYAAGGTTLRTYEISSTGLLSVSGGDAVLANEAGWDAAFSNNGGLLHVPELGQIQSFVLSDGLPGQSVSIPLARSSDRAIDVDVRPGGGCMLISIQGSDSIRSYTLGRNGRPETLLEQDLGFRPATGDFAENGHYYLGENGAPSVHVFKTTPGGLLSELADSPLEVAGTGGAYFTALDLTERLVISTDGNPNNRLDVRLRQTSGALLEGSTHSQGLSIPGQFAFLLFREP